MTLQPGTLAILHIAPGRLARYQGQECDVVNAIPNGAVVYIEIRMGDGSGAVLPSSYLRPVATAQKTRRSPLRLVPDADTRSEAEKQQEGINWLRDHGYTVLLVGQYMRRIQCEKCGEWQWPKGYGNSPGYPDISISHPLHWAAEGRRRPVLLVEYKRNEKEPERTEAQLKLAAAGISGIVWSLAMLLTEVYEFEREWIPAGVHPEVEAWLHRHGLLPEGDVIK